MGNQFGPGRGGGAAPQSRGDRRRGRPRQRWSSKGGRRGWARKLHGNEEVPFPGSVGEDVGRRVALRGEVRAAALMEACGASGRASRGPRSSARGEGEREEAKTNLATATATTGLSGGGGRRRATRGHRHRNGDGEATASAACRAEQQRGCVSRTGAARGELVLRKLGA